MVRIGVITPVQDGAHHIGETIASIVNQSVFEDSAQIEVLYVIQDGDSQDGTPALAEKQLEASCPPGIMPIVQSGPDSGMYDALTRGMETIDQHGGADWYCYLNAGDIWDRDCLRVLTAIDHQVTDPWICGLHAYYSSGGPLVHTRLPFRYSSQLLRHGAYGRGLPTIQQESTFWRASMQSLVDLDRLRMFRVAGDSFLWWSFAERAEPAIIEVVLAGFRYHGGHLGVDDASYRNEIESFAGSLGVDSRTKIPIERILWEQPARVKARLNPQLYLYKPGQAAWVSQRGALSLS